mmetsp:Transcript_10394/g.24466  ORF Transcript_10394/g.24466 Transcript_10394/m.24466 type:complete len:284 (+) Transcript_10394:630-1481(+)
MTSARLSNASCLARKSLPLASRMRSSMRWRVESCCSSACSSRMADALMRPDDSVFFIIVFCVPLGVRVGVSTSYPVLFNVPFIVDPRALLPPCPPREAPPPLRRGGRAIRVVPPIRIVPDMGAVMLSAAAVLPSASSWASSFSTIFWSASGQRRSMRWKSLSRRHACMHSTARFPACRGSTEPSERKWTTTGKRRSRSRHPLRRPPMCSTIADSDTATLARMLAFLLALAWSSAEHVRVSVQHSIIAVKDFLASSAMKPDVSVAFFTIMVTRASSSGSIWCLR